MTPPQLELSGFVAGYNSERRGYLMLLHRINPK